MPIVLSYVSPRFETPMPAVIITVRAAWLSSYLRQTVFSLASCLGSVEPDLLVPEREHLHADELRPNRQLAGDRRRHCRSHSFTISNAA